MSVQIDLPDSTYEKLQSLAVGFVDTPATVIERLIKAYKERETSAISQPQSPGISESLGDSVRVFDPSRPPDLFHTIVQGEFNGVRFSRWNDLVRIAMEQTYKKAGSFEALKRYTNAQIREGSHSDSGYRYIPQIGISVQNVDANHAWQHACRLAQLLRVPIQATVDWRLKENASYPGQRGLLKWDPS